MTVELGSTLRQALMLAEVHKHEYVTLEIFLYALIHQPDVEKTLRAWETDTSGLSSDLGLFIKKDLVGLVTDKPGEPMLNAAVQRILQRAPSNGEKSNNMIASNLDALEAIFAEHESRAVYFLNKYKVLERLVRHAVDVQDHFEHQDSIPLPDEYDFQPDPPPELPPQGIGPHIELKPEGIIDFAPSEALDNNGNYLPVLQAYHPDLRELAQALVHSLSRGNAPHAVLLERVAAYASLINQRLDLIDFRRLYISGVRLENAVSAVKDAISVGDIPPLEPSEQEKLSSLLVLHGPFILASTIGNQAKADEDRYQRRPAEEVRYRENAVAMATALQNRPDLVAPEVAEVVLGAARDIGQGDNPERSTVAGLAVMRNVALGIIGGAVGATVINYGSIALIGAGAYAVYLSNLTVSEAIKKMKWFKSLTSSIASKGDDLLDEQSKGAAEQFRHGLYRQREFVLKNEELLRQMAGSRKEFKFLHQTLDWLKKRSSK